MATVSGVWIISEESYTMVAVSEKITYPVNFKIDLSQSEEYYATDSFFSSDFVSIQLRPTNNDFMRIDTSDDYGVIYSTTLPIALDFGTGQTVDDELYAWLTKNATSPEPEQPTWTFSLRDFLSGAATAAASRGVLPRRVPIGYSYNGVVLPGLPEWDKETYPYALIYTVVGVSTTTYRLLLMDFIPEHQDYKVGIATYDQAYGTGNYVDYGISNNEWVRIEDKTVTDGTFAIGRWKWSNINISDADGNVAIVASNPVPVYE